MSDIPKTDVHALGRCDLDGCPIHPRHSSLNQPHRPDEEVFQARGLYYVFHAVHIDLHLPEHPVDYELVDEGPFLVRIDATSGNSYKFAHPRILHGLDKDSGCVRVNSGGFASLLETSTAT